MGNTDLWIGTNCLAARNSAVSEMNDFKQVGMSRRLGNGLRKRRNTGVAATPQTVRREIGTRHTSTPDTVVRRSPASPRWAMEGHCVLPLGVASARGQPNGTPTRLPRAGACGRHRDDIYYRLSSTSPSQRDRCCESRRGPARLTK